MKVETDKGSERQDQEQDKNRLEEVEEQVRVGLCVILMFGLSLKRKLNKRKVPNPYVWVLNEIEMMRRIRLCVTWGWRLDPITSPESPRRRHKR